MTSCGTYLASETVKEQEENEEHNPSPLCASVFAINIKVKCQFIGRGHEHGNTSSNEDCNNVIILGICQE